MFKLKTFGIAVMLSASFANANTNQLNVYSGRGDALIKPLIEAYSSESWHSSKLSK